MRVPPHDLTIEAQLLGAAMLTGPWGDKAAEIVAGAGADLYYDIGHGHVADAIATLVAEGSSCDTGMVASTLRQRGLLDAVGGPNRLHDLQAACPGASRAAAWVELLADFRARRRQLGLLTEMANAIYEGIPTSGLAAELHAAATESAVMATSSWQVLDLTAVLAGEGKEAQPVYLLRTDGQPLLYPGKVHALNAAPEAGKSWLALAACVERMRAGSHALYLDFEDSPVDIVTRLLELGAQPGEILERFHYIHPSERLDAAAQVHLAGVLAAWEISVAVVDGLAEALALNAMDENDASDVTRFFVLLPRVIAATGAAVLLIDHVVKDAEKQGRYARGSGAKLAGIDGAVYRLEQVRPFARGRDGMAKLVVAKDRHGWIRKAAHNATVAAELHLCSPAEGQHVTVELRPCALPNEGRWRPTIVMERMSRELETAREAVATRTLLGLVTGKHEHKVQALKELVDGGYVSRQARGQAILHQSVRPFRQDAESDDSDPDKEF